VSLASQDFFLGRKFYNLADLNTQLDTWLAEVANARLHGTTNLIVREAFIKEQSALQNLPAPCANIHENFAPSRLV